MNEKNRFEGMKSRQVAYFRPYRGHIHNPGMGIISMAISDHMITGYTPEEREKNDAKKPFVLTEEMMDAVTDISYIDNIYIRVGWNDVQRESGKLSIIPEMEMAIEKAKEAGKSWGFRIMQCSPSNPGEHTIPEFLADKLPMQPYYGWCGYGPKPRKLPLYTDDFLKYWEEMLLMLGEKYDADPNLEYADISGYGLWGEGHHGCQLQPDGALIDLELDSFERTEEIIEQLVKSHKTAFSRTPMVANLVWSKYEAIKNAIEEGCWVRRDSYQELPDRVCDYGAAYGIIGFNPMDTLFADRMMPQLFDAYKNRLGYRLRPSIIWYLEKEDGSRGLALGMVNDGCANPPGVVRFCAETGGVQTSVEVDGSMFGSRMFMVELPLAKADSDTVILSVQLMMGGKTYPVRFAADVRTNSAPFELKIQLKH